MSFKDYKKNKSTTFEKLQQQVAALNAPTNSFEADPDDWYPSTDKAGNGTAIIRFLPCKEDEELNLVHWISHAFKNAETDRWYIENSLKTLGKEIPDPVAEYNKRLWNSGDSKEHPARKQASNQGRKLNYRTNIFIVSDPIHPENNGTVKKWKFGKFFADMIDLAVNPKVVEGDTEPDAKLDPFDLYDGANLKIVIFSVQKGGKAQRDYSRSAWRERGPLGDEKLMEKVYNQIQTEDKWSLKQYISKDKFKTYEELKKRLDFVSGIDTTTGRPLEVDTSKNTQKEDRQERQSSVKENKKEKVTEDGDDAYFNKLVDNGDDDIPF